MIEDLGTSQCWALIRGADFGRLAVWVDGEPEIVPVNHAVDHGSLVFRTAHDSRVGLAPPGTRVAFEVDGFDAGAGQAWSVVVKGRNHRIVNLHELVDSAQLPLTPWHPGRKHLLLRLEPDQISGRRFQVVAPTMWSNPLTGAPTSRPE